MGFRKRQLALGSVWWSDQNILICETRCRRAVKYAHCTAPCCTARRRAAGSGERNPPNCLPGLLPPARTFFSSPTTCLTARMLGSACCKLKADRAGCSGGPNRRRLMWRRRSGREHAAEACYTPPGAPNWRIPHVCARSKRAEAGGRDMGRFSGLLEDQPDCPQACGTSSTRGRQLKGAAQGCTQAAVCAY